MAWCQLKGDWCAVWPCQLDQGSSFRTNAATIFITQGGILVSKQETLWNIQMRTQMRIWPSESSKQWKGSTWQLITWLKKMWSQYYQITTAESRDGNISYYTMKQCSNLPFTLIDLWMAQKVSNNEKIHRDNRQKNLLKLYLACDEMNPLGNVNVISLINAGLWATTVNQKWEDKINHSKMNLWMKGTTKTGIGNTVILWYIMCSTPSSHLVDKNICCDKQSRKFTDLTKMQ